MILQFLLSSFSPKKGGREGGREGSESCVSQMQMEILLLPPSLPPSLLTCPLSLEWSRRQKAARGRLERGKEGCLYM